MWNNGKYYSSKKECECCVAQVANKKNVPALWAKNLDRCKTKNPCLNSRSIQQTLFKNKSKKMEQAHLAQHSHRGWRSVSWARFQLEKKTKTFRTKNINQGDLFYPAEKRCGKNPEIGTQFTIQQVNALTPRKLRQDRKISCGNPSSEIIQNEELYTNDIVDSPQVVTDIYIQ